MMKNLIYDILLISIMLLFANRVQRTANSCRGMKGMDRIEAYSTSLIIVGVIQIIILITRNIQ